MREHAIPQDITGYRFHIIGNMTLKQFAEIAAGCFVGFLFYTTNLPTPIKWPLIGVSIGLGAMVAFVPVEERPLDHWLVTFIKVLYKPTKFFWRRVPKIPEAFTYTATDLVTADQQEIDLRPARKQRIKEYLRSVEPPKAMDAFDWSRLQQINSLMTTFNQVIVNTVDIQEAVQKPDLRVRVRSLAPQNTTTELSQPTEIPETVLPNSPVLSSSDIDSLLLQNQTDAYANLADRNTDTYHSLATQDVAQNIFIPEVQGITIDHTHEDSLQSDEAESLLTQQRGVYLTEVIPTQIVSSEQNVTTNANLPFPTAPTEPNKVVGMVLTPNNEIVTGAIIEIQGGDGQVARAVKSNALGQFFITTPLEKGSYTMVIEKDGLEFVPLRLDIDGHVLPPIEVRSI